MKVWILLLLLVQSFSIQEKVFTNPFSIETITPPANYSLQNSLRSYRHAVLPIVQSSKLNYQGHPCGIMWALASINGSRTNYEELIRVGRGEGHYRLLTVVHEVFTSAARIKNSLSMNADLPDICIGPDGQKKLSLIIFLDRDIVTSTKNHDLLSDMKCIFDQIIYYDDLPDIESLIPVTPYSRLHMLVRLAPRPNVMKVAAFLSTPFQYTLYLDGDTAPCAGFQMPVFSLIRDHDVLSTPNPFGYQSTNGKKVYPGSPAHADYADFAEINGGVFGYRWNSLTEDLIIRTLELFPYFSGLGFDQDQAMMRHALFESQMLSSLKVHKGTMDRFCRSGWNCDTNNCFSKCLVIHQRNCVRNGVTQANKTDSSSCAVRANQVYVRMLGFGHRNWKLNVANRPNRAKILQNQD